MNNQASKGDVLVVQNKTVFAVCNFLLHMQLLKVIKELMGLGLGQNSDLNPSLWLLIFGPPNMNYNFLYRHLI